MFCKAHAFTSTPFEIWQNSGFKSCVIPKEYDFKKSFFIIFGFALFIIHFSWLIRPIPISFRWARARLTAPAITAPILTGWPWTCSPRQSTTKTPRRSWSAGRPRISMPWRPPSSACCPPWSARRSSAWWTSRTGAALS